MFLPKRGFVCTYVNVLVLVNVNMLEKKMMAVIYYQKLANYFDTII